MVFNYLSTADRPARVGRVRPRGPRHPQPAGVRAVQRRRALPRSLGRDRRGDPRLGARRRRDRAAPVVHRRHGRRRDVGRRPGDDARARRRGPARRRRLGLPLRHQRQHLRARDDGRREGRRPDPRATPRCHRPKRPGTASATAARSTRPATAATQRGAAHDRTPPSPPPRPDPERRRRRGARRRASGRSSARGRHDHEAARTPSSRARSCRRRPATWSASATSASTSRPARSSW